MIYEVVGKLIARGAAMSLRQEGVVRYAPVPPEEFLDQLHREHEALITALQRDLSSLTAAPDLEYVWNIEGRENILAKAEEMVRQAGREIYLSLTPATFPQLRLLCWRPSAGASGWWSTRRSRWTCPAVRWSSLRYPKRPRSGWRASG